MIFYKTEIKSIPGIRFACSSSTDQYKNVVRHRSNLLEITTLTGAGVYMETGKQRTYIPPSSVIITFPDMDFRLHSAGEGEVCDDSVAMQIDDFSFSRIDTENFPGGAMSDGSLADENILILPQVLTLGDDFLNITRLMRTIISCHIQNNATSRYRCLSLWFELLAVLNGLCRDRLFGNNEGMFLPSADMYVRKAKKYMEAHYSRKILIQDIAKELRITPNYLSNMFKRITGKTVLEYLNMIRIQAARDLISKDVSLAAVAQKTGFGSQRYLCELFKRYYGVSVQQFKLISNEISLYHVKPWEVESLDRDVIDEVPAKNPDVE